MTIKLYDEHPYETEFDAKVLSCEESKSGTFKLTFDQTLFFPEEGGQTCDKGCIFIDGKQIEVMDVQIDKENTITHTVGTSVAVGETIHGTIDWDHRFSNMQNHTAEHIFSGLVFKHFGYTNIGFHLSDNEVTMDYDGVLSDEDVRFIELEVNKAIVKNVKVNCSYPDAETLSTTNYRSKKKLEGAIRIVEVEGYDICACCAPHVKNTGEIGSLKVISTMANKGGTRVSILSGFRALNEFNRILDAAYLVSHEYSIPIDIDRFKKAIDTKKEAYLELRGKYETLSKNVLLEKVAGLDPTLENVIFFVNDVDDVLKRDILNDLVTKHPGFCAFFDGDDNNGYSFIIASQNMNCNDIIKRLKEKFEIRGGGKPIMVSGKVKASQAELEGELN